MCVRRGTRTKEIEQMSSVAVKCVYCMNNINPVSINVHTDLFCSFDPLVLICPWLVGCTNIETDAGLKGTNFRSVRFSVRSN